MTGFASIASGGVAALRTLLFPPHCGACGTRLDHDGLICEPCRRSIPFPTGALCPLCSHPLEGAAPCPNCEGRRWHLSVIVAGCRYNGLVRDLIHRFKYGGDQSLAPLLANLTLPCLEDSRFSGRSFDAIVPVPLHPLRERERGFNQAGLLALELGRTAGLPVAALLRRKRDTAHQARFDRARRLKNLEGAFCTRGKVGQDTRLLLVDDVCTTGITLDVCARVLLEAGASEVCAVTMARG